MMPNLSNRWYIRISRGLLGYLLGLYLIGFSWHLLEHPSSPHPSPTSDHGTMLLSDNGCFICDWLVHHTYTVPDLLPEIALSTEETLHFSFFRDATFVRACSTGAPRAPPSVG